MIFGAPARLAPRGAARHEMERRFLAPLGEEGASSLLRSLRVLVTDPRVTA